MRISPSLPPVATCFPSGRTAAADNTPPPSFSASLPTSAPLAGSSSGTDECPTANSVLPSGAKERAEVTGPKAPGFGGATRGLPSAGSHTRRPSVQSLVTTAFPSGLTATAATPVGWGYTRSRRVRWASHTPRFWRAR